jgi:hypothetical protein
MRLGEVKQVIDEVLDDNNQIVIEHNSIYGGQAYLIDNFRELVVTYDIISDLAWNDVDNTQLDPVIIKYRDFPNPVQLEQAEFNLLNTYVSAVNQKIPYYYSILEEMVEDQDEQTINIKLPEKIDSFDDLSDLNKRLQKTLHFFNVDGEFSFQSFDKGSDWYVVVTQGLLSSAYLISCLKIAQEILKLRTEYFKSEEAQISYEVAKGVSEKLTPSKFQNDWIDKYLSAKVKEVMEEIVERNGAAETELQVKLIKGVTALVKEFDEGVEFHLSLNPPSFVDKVNGGLKIDYKKIRQIRAEEDKKLGKGKTKELAAPTENEEVEIDDQK